MQHETISPSAVGYEYPQMAHIAFPKGLFLSIALMLFIISAPAMAQDSLHQQAQQQSRSGDIQGMADTYQRILQDNPNDVDARLGYATAQSWMGNHAVAQNAFEQILTRHPDHLAALSGLAYNHAWAKQYAQAESRFRQAISMAPDNAGVHKGLALTYLWGNQPEKALNKLDSLVEQYPEDPEIHAARGQALALLDQDQQAEQAFEKTLSLQPGREDAITGLAAIRDRQPKFDISAWYGSTSNGGESGLREITLGYELKNASRIWIRYDDSLSLDNPALARANQKAETIYLGLESSLKTDWRGIFEFGNRDLPAGADQQIYKFEAINIQPTRVYKLGLQLSPHSDNFTDKLLYAGIGYPLTSRWRLEPTVYLSSSGSQDDSEIRTVLFAEYLSPEQWTIGLGGGIGKISSDNNAADGSVFVANTLFSYPLTTSTRLQLSLRYEDAPSNSITTTLIGITARLP